MHKLRWPGTLNGVWPALFPELLQRNAADVLANYCGMAVPEVHSHFG